MSICHSFLLFSYKTRFTIPLQRCHFLLALNLCFPFLRHNYKKYNYRVKEKKCETTDHWFFLFAFCRMGTGQIGPVSNPLAISVRWNHKLKLQKPCMLKQAAGKWVQNFRSANIICDILVLLSVKVLHCESIIGIVKCFSCVSVQQCIVTVWYCCSSWSLLQVLFTANMGMWVSNLFLKLGIGGMEQELGEREQRIKWPSVGCW